MRDAGYGGRPEGGFPFLSETLFFGIAGLTGCGVLGKLDGLPRSMACVGCVMVGVRFLRTQQRVKSQCLIGFR